MPQALAMAARSVLPEDGVSWPPYYGLAVLVKAFGPAALSQWRRHKLRASLVAALALLALWALFQWLGDLAGTV